MSDTAVSNIKVIDAKPVGGVKATIILEGPNIEAVQGLDARNLAQAEAAKLISRPGLSSPSGPYPVDADGECTDALLAGKVPVAAYRQDFTYQGGA